MVLLPSLSALLLAGEYLGRICPAAPLDTGFAGIELLRSYEAAGAFGAIAIGVLPALVTKGILHGADLGRVWAASETEAVTCCETTGT